MRITQLVLILFLLPAAAAAQGFEAAASGEQVFVFNDPSGMSQAAFFSTTPLEDIEGVTNEVTGQISLDLTDIAGSLSGSVSFPITSLDTGIGLRNDHLLEADWLDAENHPDVSFEITGVDNVESAGEGKMQADVKGLFTMHGVSKEITPKVTLIYLAENDQTRERMPGDLLGVQSEFLLQLSDFDIDNVVVGSKVAETITITVNIVGSNGI